MPIQLQVTSQSKSAEELQEVTENIRQDLEREAKITATLGTSKGKVGGKGEPITLGLIVLSFLTSGAAVAFFNALKSYLDKDSTFTFTMTKKSGDSLTIKTKNVSSASRDQTLAKIAEFFKESD